MKKTWEISPYNIFASPYIPIYKITKIVRALWLAERSVCMRVCKHGCGVKLFGFSRANHASTNLKKFSSSKLDKFALFTHSFVGWNMENRYKEGESIFLRLSWHFKRQKSGFGGVKHLFPKQELITRARLRGQDFATGNNFSFNQCRTKSFAFFSPGKLFYKSNRTLFSCVCIAWYKHSRHWENSRLSRILPTPLVFISGYANTENVFYCLNIARLADLLFIVVIYRVHFHWTWSPYL